MEPRKESKKRQRNTFILGLILILVLISFGLGYGYFITKPEINEGLKSILIFWELLVSGTTIAAIIETVKSKKLEKKLKKDILFIENSELLSREKINKEVLDKVTDKTKILMSEEELSLDNLREVSYRDLKHMIKASKRQNPELVKPKVRKRKKI